MANSQNMTPRTGRSGARQAAILTAVEELIAEIGYERMTVDAIAKRAQASKATMYRRWPGKAEIVADALKLAAEGNTTAAPDNGSLSDDLLYAVKSITDAITGRHGPALLGLVEGVRDDPKLRDLVQTQIESRLAVDGPLISSRARARGEHITVSDTAPALRLAIASILLSTLLTGQPPTRSEQQKLVNDLLLPLVASP